MALNTTFLYCAAAMSFVTFLLHSFAVHRNVVRPLLKADLRDVSKYTHYYCWHLVTLTLLGMAVSYGISATYPNSWELAVAATLLAALFCGWSIILFIWKKQSPLTLPQWMLFAVITAFGVGAIQL